MQGRRDAGMQGNGKDTWRWPGNVYQGRDKETIFSTYVEMIRWCAAKGSQGRNTYLWYYCGETCI